jgi:hypothetical protein
MSIVFRGVRYRGAIAGRTGHTQVRMIGEGQAHDLPVRLDVVNHSPTGFEWGYGGSGPAQLALAMLLALGVEPSRATLWHQDVKRELVAPLDDDEWEIAGDDVLRALEAAEHGETLRGRDA